MSNEVSNYVTELVRKVTQKTGLSKSAMYRLTQIILQCNILDLPRRPRKHVWKVFTNCATVRRTSGA